MGVRFGWVLQMNVVLDVGGWAQELDLGYWVADLLGIRCYNKCNAPHIF